MKKTYILFFLIKNKLHWHICRLLHSPTVSEKQLKIPIFGPSLIHHLQLLGSQQCPQCEVLLTSFSTWGKENNPAEINLESTGLIKGCNICWGQKFADTCSFVGGRIIVKQEKISSRMQLVEPVECTSGGNPLLLYKILHSLFFPLVQILCALCL